jgi:hypothetical protein
LSVCWAFSLVAWKIMILKLWVTIFNLSNTFCLTMWVHYIFWSYIN